MLHSQTNISKRKRHLSEIDNDFLSNDMDENLLDRAHQVGRICRLIGDEMNTSYAPRRYFILVIPTDLLSNLCSKSLKIMAFVCRISLLV